MATGFGNWNRNAILRLAAVTGLGLSASACVYGPEDGYGPGYAANQCDPNYEFDSYYDCDYNYGFANIGYGGGWYQDYYYPGYGLFLFDTYGRRHQMHGHFGRYWGNQRYRWFRQRHRGHRGGRRYRDGGGYDVIAWPRA